MESVEEVLHSIAVRVYHGDPGAFLRTYADAYLQADSENQKKMRPTWMHFIEKYLLDKKGEHVQTHLSETEREVNG